MRISLTKLKKTLSNCAFDPRKDILMKPVVENIENYPDYAVMKSIERLREYQELSKQFLKDAKPGELIDGSFRFEAESISILQEVIGLLALRIALQCGK